MYTFQRNLELCHQTVKHLLEIKAPDMNLRKLFEEERKRTETLEKAVFLALRKSILAGYLFPGEKLLENELAERIGISRTPIRAAILRLEKEQLVVTTPQKGATVIRLSPAQVEEGYVLMGVFQGFAAYLALPNFNRQMISKMEALHSEMNSEELLEKYRDWLRKNNEFHSIFINASGNLALTEMIRSNLGRLTRYWYLACSFGFLKKSIHYHSRIIQEIKRGDADGLRKIVEEHFFESGKDIRAHLERTLA
jgi:DNA-binding GntR family transcriptional regulator